MCETKNDKNYCCFQVITIQIKYFSLVRDDHYASVTVFAGRRKRDRERSLDVNETYIGTTHDENN